LGLEHSGEFEVDVYNDPITALSNYRPGVFDLLLLDIKMPKMSGLELYQNIREKYKGKENGEVKVCFITAFEEYFKEFERLFPNYIDIFTHPDAFLIRWEIFPDGKKAKSPILD
jgi:two-component system catabolic regulation response regulator CreB/two-component system response regulator ChvI